MLHCFPKLKENLLNRLVLLIMPFKTTGTIVLRDGCDIPEMEFNYMISNPKGALDRLLNIIYCSLYHKHKSQLIPVIKSRSPETENSQHLVQFLRLSLFHTGPSSAHRSKSSALKTLNGHISQQKLFITIVDHKNCWSQFLCENWHAQLYTMFINEAPGLPLPDFSFHDALYSVGPASSATRLFICKVMLLWWMQYAV